ncbi:MAG: copper resistance protein CopC [Pseudonocardia sp.]|nr:copper resistance protein CopC [Pseudonocardia sp.]
MTSPPHRYALRAGSLLMVCGLAMLLGVGPATAHTRLQNSDPADGASVATPPTSLALTFDEPMQPGFSTITLIGPDGVAYQTGDTTVDGGAVGTALLPLGPAGRYEVGYRVVSDDGHPVTGGIAFTLTAPGPGAAGPAASTSAASTSAASTSAGAPAPATPSVTPAAAVSDDRGAPAWPWIVGAVLLVGGAVVTALRLGRG